MSEVSLICLLLCFLIMFMYLLESNKGKKELDYLDYNAYSWLVLTLGALLILGDGIGRAIDMYASITRILLRR